ncbi:hypothetical protein GHT06_019686 [Daphnia sinensis]|uniref:Uncharacterized protein n=1 Tax=Daphnia sinensis TaxID=1820382 RepID=A0AAD5PRM4_9CRUS|nr:hypothetical protein GHT06_019686 [Daphnia sinensis]
MAAVFHTRGDQCPRQYIVLAVSQNLSGLRSADAQPPFLIHLGCLPRRNLYNTRLFISNKTVDRHKSQRSISKQPIQDIVNDHWRLL